MAEKNTHSILETIKKKMQKLDQKSELKNSDANFDDEFEYIVPTKKEVVIKTESEVGESPFAEAKKDVEVEKEVAPKIMPKFEDDLGLEEENQDAEVVNSENLSPFEAAFSEEKIAEVEQNVVEAAPQNLQEVNLESPIKPAKEDFNLNDLDLDDESDLTHNQPAQVKAVLDRVMEGENFSEDDIEDYEDEVDIDEEMADIINDVAAVMENKNDDVEDDLEDDFKFEEPESEQDNLILEDPAEEVVEKASDELNFDDLEFEIHVSEPAVNQAKTAYDALDDISLEELERQAATPVVKPIMKEVKTESVVPAKVEQKAPQATVQDDIDLEFEKELMGFSPSNNVPAPKAAAPLPQAVFEPVFVKVEEKIIPQIIEPIIEKKEEELSAAAENLNWYLAEKIEPIVEKKTAPSVEQEASKVQMMPVSGSRAKNPLSDTIIYDTTLSKTNDSIRRLLDAKNVVNGIAAFSQSPAFSELAVQLMEPKLEKWLNEHLPEVVEKIVREEIRKIIPKD